MTKAESNAAQKRNRARSGDGNVVPTCKGDGNDVPVLLSDELPEPHPVILSLKKLATMIDKGSVLLSASPKNKNSATKLKTIAQELEKHGLPINVNEKKGSK